MSTETRELLKISELAETSGVPVATVRHYLREGLLPEPVKTSRNMAYYPPEFAERIRLIKQLQEERFLPLKVIRELLDSGDGEPDRLRALIELEDRILDRALAGEHERVPRCRGPRPLRRPARGARPARRARRAGRRPRRLLALGRPHRRGDQPLPRGRLRRAHRVHGLRHAALQARDGGSSFARRSRC